MVSDCILLSHYQALAISPQYFLLVQAGDWGKFLYVSVRRLHMLHCSQTIQTTQCIHRHL